MTVQLLTNACANGLSCLDKRQLLIAWAQSKSGGATAAQLLADACANGISCLDTKQLLTVIAQANNPS